MRRTLLAVSLFLALTASPSIAAAQCLGADGLTGPCCSTTNPTLPAFTGFALPGTSICWVDCDPTQQNSAIQVGTPVLAACGQYTAPITVIDGTGAAILSGALWMDYTRTWNEVTPGAAGATLQVYRFVVKIDMSDPDPGSGDPCNTPSCLASLHSAFYYGYLDFTYDCATAAQSNVLVLFHNCDVYIHDSGFSATPGAYHPATSYALVYPSSTANPFVASFLSPPAAAIVGEGMRHEPVPGAACFTEDRIASGTMAHWGDGCVCEFAASPLQVSARYMFGKASCTTTAGKTSFFVSTNLFPTYPWYDVLTTSIGSWTTGATYPGNERAWVDEDVFFVRDVCSQRMGGPRKFIETYYGATTDFGFDVVPNSVNPSITRRMTDLASNHSYTFPGSLGPIYAGVVIPTRNVLYLSY